MLFRPGVEGTVGPSRIHPYVGAHVRTCKVLGGLRRHGGGSSQVGRGQTATVRDASSPSPSWTPETSCPVQIRTQGQKEVRVSLGVKPLSETSVRDRRHPRGSPATRAFHSRTSTVSDSRDLVRSTGNGPSVGDEGRSRSGRGELFESFHTGVVGGTSAPV